MEKIFLIVLYFARQARITKFCGLDLATENFAKFRESMKTVEFFHVAYSFLVMSIGNRGSKIFWIEIESPRGTIFILGGALGPNGGRLLIFLVENDDGLSANIWFPEARPSISDCPHFSSSVDAILATTFFKKTLNNSADSICALRVQLNMKKIDRKVLRDFFSLTFG